MSTGKPILYSFWFSSCSWRVRTALALKEIPYELKTVSLPKSIEDSISHEYRKVNPMAQVPAMEIDGHTITDSVAIMHYLEETRPQVPLLPKDPFKRAKVREIVEVICSGIQPLQNTSVLHHVGEEKQLEWAQHYIRRGFSALEKILSNSAGKYCVGDEITMADICLVPQVYNAKKRFNMDMNEYPTIAKINEELQTHPAFITGHPLRQPDCPDDLKITN